jgi:protein subunit release factor A
LHDDKEKIMTTVLVEIRAAEGGEDSKLLVEDQLRIYSKMASLECL